MVLRFVVGLGVGGRPAGWVGRSDLDLWVYSRPGAYGCCAKMGANGTSAFNGHCSSTGGAHASNYFFLSPPAEADLVWGGGGPMHIKSHDCPELCLVRGSRPDEGGAVGLALGPCAGGGAATAWVRVP